MHTDLADTFCSSIMGLVTYAAVGLGVPLARHDICQKIYTARFSGYSFYTAKVRDLRHFSTELTV